MKKMLGLIMAGALGVSMVPTVAMASETDQKPGVSENVQVANQVNADQVQSAALGVSAEDKTLVPFDEAHFPDKNFRAKLQEDYADAIENGYISIDKMYPDKGQLFGDPVLDVSNSSIRDLTGVEYITDLVELNCSGNQLETLDVSKNTKLEILECNNNRLSSLDLSKNVSLSGLECSSNQLTDLDLSNNAQLMNLMCNENQITSLDVGMCPELTIIECNANKLTSLDVTKNVKLSQLSCNSNQLAGLDISKNETLEMLWCEENKISTLDITKNKELFYLFCDDEVDVTGHLNRSLNSSQFAVNYVEDVIYTGKPVTQKYLLVTFLEVSLVEGRDYTVSYENNVNAGTATVLITGKGDYKDTIKKTFKITKAKNPMTMKKASGTYTFSAKARTLTTGVSKAQGKVSCTPDKAAKTVKITATSTGKVTIPAKCPVGTYKVSFKAAGNNNYNAESKTVTIKVTQATNPLKVKVPSKSYKSSKLTKVSTFSIGVTGSQGKVSYTLDKKAKAAKIKVSKTGKVTVPKKCRKGTYQITVKAAGNKNYKAGKKIVKIVVK